MLWYVTYLLPKLFTPSLPPVADLCCFSDNRSVQQPKMDLARYGMLLAVRWYVMSLVCRGSLVLDQWAARHKWNVVDAGMQFFLLRFIPFWFPVSNAFPSLRAFVHILVSVTFSWSYDLSVWLDHIFSLWHSYLAVPFSPSIVPAFQTTEIISLLSRVPGGELHILSSTFVHICLFFPLLIWSPPIGFRLI